ncbi:MAG: NUDIX domain-containing protein [Opitutae bacterium]|nr:NUDIX domain-containing protein [Opitutae bacterium]MCD8298956.1 NUDIX domain-containing protein [Opitutae bacterium]
MNPRQGENSHAPRKKFIQTNPIRVAARAVVVKDNKLLAVVLSDQSGPFYVLPGGGQKHGEELYNTVRRECAEELGIIVEPYKMLYVREYIGKNHDFAARHKHFHQVEIVFACDLVEEGNIGHGSDEDARQVGYEWLPLENLRDTRFFPSLFKTFLNEKNELEIPTDYLGDIN